MSGKMDVQGRITFQDFVYDNSMLVFWGSLVFLALAVGIAGYLRYRDRRQRKRLAGLEKSLSEAREQMQALIRQTSTITWRYEYMTHRVYRLNQDMDLGEQDEIVENVPEYYVKKQLIAPEYQQQFLKMYQLLFAGVQKTEGVFRMRLRENTPWTWQRITYINHYDEQGNVAEAFGYANDITLEKEKEAVHMPKEELDPLTGVLNRYAFGAAMGEILRDRRDSHLSNIFCLLDVDDFQDVNERFGNQEGDLLLNRLAQILNRACRRSDLIGRADGDEFMILFVGVYDTKRIGGKLSRLLERIHRIALPDGSKLTVSMGATVAGEEDTMDDLRQRAEAALGRAKSAGKDCYVMEEELTGSSSGCQ